MSGRLLILSGPSGVGKDTVLDAWRAVNPLVERVVAVTTRPQRPSEVEGLDYHFVSREVFSQMVDRARFLEHKCVHGHLYGTPLDGVERLLGEGKVAVLKIDVQGAATVLESRPDAETVFLLPPSHAVLEERLRHRGSDDEDTIARRLQNALVEMGRSELYRHRIVNDEVDKVVAQLQRIVGAAL